MDLNYTEHLRRTKYHMESARSEILSLNYSVVFNHALTIHNSVESCRVTKIVYFQKNVILILGFRLSRDSVARHRNFRSFVLLQWSTSLGAGCIKSGRIRLGWKIHSRTGPKSSCHSCQRSYITC